MVKFAAIVVEDIDNAKYKKLILKNTISTMEMSRDMENEVLLSPLNWYIICRFNKELISAADSFEELHHEQPLYSASSFKAVCGFK